VEALERHEELVRACSLCFPGGGNAPVVDVPKDVRVLLVAQAPGLTEVLTRLPFTGPAGARLEGWFTEAGVSRGENTSPPSRAASLERRRVAGTGCPLGR
jgi:uracil-DNA glycosylase